MSQKDILRFLSTPKKYATTPFVLFSLGYSALPPATRALTPCHGRFHPKPVTNMSCDRPR